MVLLLFFDRFRVPVLGNRFLDVAVVVIAMESSVSVVGCGAVLVPLLVNLLIFYCSSKSFRFTAVGFTRLQE